MENLFKREINTPIGTMVALASSKGLCALEFYQPKRQKLLSSRLRKEFEPYSIVAGKNEFLDQAERWIKSYFAKDFAGLKTPRLDLRGSEFESILWKAMQKIKLGATMSYGELGAKIGKANASRAVGGGSRRNPIGLIVPCHRVIGKNGDLTGYGGGLNYKKWLLEHETN